MTDSKRSNAAGEKYALRGIYGSEPYWPHEKLKICVTGAGGFIGASFKYV
jgi:GDP-D-mannose 3',5'-epimerase